MFTNIDVYRPTWISTGNEPDFDCFIISKDCYFESNSKKKTPPKVNKQHKKKKKKNLFPWKSSAFLELKIKFLQMDAA